MKELIRRIRRMIRREMIPEDVGEQIITKIGVDAHTHYCGNCAQIEQRDIDGRSVSWCPYRGKRVSGFDEAPSCWVSMDDLNEMMDSLARQQDEMTEAQLSLMSDSMDREVRGREKVTK